VFVIDDDPSIRSALEDILGSVGLNAGLFGSRTSQKLGIAIAEGSRSSSV
jgi:FixJ family two-component response regulator